MNIITVERKILEKNDRIAEMVRNNFRANGVFAVNILSSPGSGKTSIIEQLVKYSGDIRFGVITGDVQTDNDAQRISKTGVPVVQIITNGGCHLDASLVQEAAGKLELNAIDILIIENVGNLVCPASFDLGEEKKVVVISVTEGDDKPLKYPAIFRNSAAIIINKIDLLPYLNCSIELLKRNALSINPFLTVFETSCITGDGIKALNTWLTSCMIK